MTDERNSLTLYADYVCPFCYLGRRALDAYVEGADDPPAVEWHPFDLRSRKRGPDGELDLDADDGKDDAYYEQAKQNVRRLQERYDVEMAREIATDVDSLPAQVASSYVKEAHPERWPDFDEAIFGALWVDERDVGDPDVLVELAEGVGLDGDEIHGTIADEGLRSRVTDLFDDAHRRGVTGVPTFVYHGRVARGAVPPDQLERLIEG